MDVIVFNSDELNSAADMGIKNICLCDNSFILSTVPGISYTAIGKVKAKINMTAAETQEKSIAFHGFVPVYKHQLKTEKVPFYANVDNTQHPSGITTKRDTGSFYGSYGSYYGSYSSFYGSYSGSLVSSFMSSFSGSFTGSFRLSSSFRAGSFAGISSFKFNSFKMPYKIRKKYVIKEISVNGYGLNLI